MGETRVDLLHLLEDLRDAYPGSLEETILTEVVANALDSGAATISARTDPVRAQLTVVDDGSGMRRRELARFHDLAASSKTRGRGIGFAGVGIKLGLLICDEVRTETRRGSVHVSSTWALASKQRAPWRWVPPEGMVAERGTAVRLTFRNPLSPLVDPGFVEQTLRRHYLTLFDPELRRLLAAQYPAGVRFFLNGDQLGDERLPSGEIATVAVRLARKRRPAAQGWMARTPAPVPEDRQGIAISTFGKVIKRGWEWLGITPTNGSRVTGLLEAPALAEALALNKADFIRSGTRGALYLAYRKALQEVISAQLAEWGDQLGGAEAIRRRAARPIERDLERVLAELTRRFPLLETLVEQRSGGQRRLPLGGSDSVPGSLVRPGETDDAEVEPASTDQEPAPTPESEPAAPPPPPFTPAGGNRSPRPARLGLSIRFEVGDAEAELARLVETTVWVNEAHPAYQRAVASRSEGYHLAVAVAMAVSPLAAGSVNEREFIAAFLARWGLAASPAKPKRAR